MTIKKGESPLLNLLYTWPTSAPSTGTDFSGSVGQVCTFGYTYNTTSVPTSVTCS